MTTETLDTDVLIIGWGKAGKTLAGKFARAGRGVVLVERSPQMYGGTCINVACVPTKDLVESAHQRRPDDDPQAYFRDSAQGRDGLIGKLNAANHKMLADVEGVTLLDGTARFTGPREVAVDTADGTTTVRATTVVISTGTEPARPPIPGADGPRVHDSTSIQHVDPFPRRLVVVGGGFIGLEFADMFAHFGAEVTVLEGDDELTPMLDRDTADELRGALEDHGVTVHLGVTVQEIVDDGGDGGDAGTPVRVVTDAGEHPADAVLLATGRKPATADLGLDAAGVEVDERGYVVVDDQLRASAEGVYAVGDVSGGPQFTYTSYDDHRIVWDAEEGAGERRRSDRVAVPSTTFVRPPLSQVGMTHAEARESGRRVLLASKKVAEIAAMPRPKILGGSDTAGRISVLIDADTDEILGATLFCIDSQELVNMVALAIRLGATAADLRDGIWTHPSSTEAFNEVLASTTELG